MDGQEYRDRFKDVLRVAFPGEWPTSSQKGFFFFSISLQSRTMNIDKQEQSTSLTTSFSFRLEMFNRKGNWLYSKRKIADTRS